MVCIDGFSYEHAHIEGWQREHDMSFVTGIQHSSKFLIPNRALKSRLQDMGLIT